MGVEVVMALETRIFCRLDGLTPTTREQRRLQALRDRGLLEAEIVAVFDEATQTAARFLEAPICILGIMTSTKQLIKSAVGLSRVGLMNPLAQLRQLPRDDCFCSYVVDSHQVLAIHDTVTNPLFVSSLLVGHYGIRAYLGAPLLTADGQCLGTLAVMDWEPRHFTTKDAEFLAITARWSLSEFERNRYLKQELTSSIHQLPNSSTTIEYQQEGESGSKTTSQEVSNGFSASLVSTSSIIKVKLLTQLTQELRTPLTSVMGMASVLGRQIYGPLTTKQKEYLEIIHQSGQHLVSLVDEIIALGILEATSDQLNVTSVNIEMLCQQAINSLTELAQARQQQIHLSIEPGNRIWLLNKDKVRQMLYYLVYGVIHSAEAESEVRIHVSRKSDKLSIVVWVSHPWLGDGLPQVGGGIAESFFPSSSPVSAVSRVLDTPLTTDQVERSNELASSAYLLSTNPALSNPSISAAFSLKQELNNKLGNNDDSRETLGLLLSCYLAELHGGEISIQGSLESGYRYVISLPQLESADKRV
jgi:signal transduction histidine kinase